MKKVFFITSPRAVKKYKAEIQKVYSSIEELGYTNTSTFIKDINPVLFYKFGKQERVEHYHRTKKDLMAADICCFEVSMHSHTIGQLIQSALDWGKPIIALYTGEKPFFLDAVETEESKLLLCKYSKEDAKEVLKDAFEYMQQEMDTRFTLILPNGMIQYLNRIARTGTTRSEYIRSLIKKDMEGK